MTNVRKCLIWSRPGFNSLVLILVYSVHCVVYDFNKSFICLLFHLGYGQDGPYRDLLGHDVNYIGYGGVLGITGPSDGAPVMLGVQIADLTTGLMVVTVILAALLVRVRMGRGQCIDVSFLDVVASLTVLPAAFYVGDGRPPKRGEWLLNIQAWAESNNSVRP